MAKKQSLICPLYAYFERFVASFDAVNATTVTHTAIFNGDDAANANSGVRRKTPTIISCTDIRDAADNIREDCTFKPMDRSNIVVKMMVDSDDASWVGFNVDVLATVDDNLLIDVGSADNLVGSSRPACFFDKCPTQERSGCLVVDGTKAQCIWHAC